VDLQHPTRNWNLVGDGLLLGFVERIGVASMLNAAVKDPMHINDLHARNCTCWDSSRVAID
jgi:hypothetical protein